MKCRFLILFFTCLLLLNQKTQAHQDFWRVMTFDNVRVRIKTGLECEEIKKCFIIGELAAKLARELNYKKPILLTFDHRYIIFKEPEDYYYSINISEGKRNKQNERRFDNYYALKKRGIVITQRDDFFDAGKTLQLLSYAIENRAILEREVKGSRKVAKPLIASVDSLSYLKSVPIIRKQISDQIKHVLQTKIYAGNGTLNYYYKEDSFHFLKIEENDTTDLIRLKNVVLTQKNIVFDTDTSFYYLDRQASTRHIINLERNDSIKEWRHRVNEFKMRVSVEKIGDDMFSFSYPVYEIFTKNQRIFATYVDCYSIYFITKDYFAQDIEHLLVEKPNQN